MQSVILNEDVFSNFGVQDKSRKPYGRKGDEVEVLFESLPALIVKTKNGERFSVNIERVTPKPI